MKSTIRLVVLGAMCCAVGCNSETTKTGTANALPPAPLAKNDPQAKGAQPTPGKPSTSVSPTTAPVAPVAQAVSALEGTWKTGCQAMGTIYLNAAFTAKGNQAYASGKIYTDSACTNVMPGAQVSQEWMTLTIGKTDASGLTQFTDVQVDESGTKTTQYNVFEIKGDTMTVGQGSTDPNQYPTTTDQTILYKKQAQADVIPPAPSASK